MSSNPKTVAYLVEQIAAAGAVSAKAMFGEYGVYCDGKMVAMICDDRLYVKPTAAGCAYALDLDTASPYPGAKPHIHVDADRWEDADWLAEFVRITAAGLPAPKAKSQSRSKA